MTEALVPQDGWGVLHLFFKLSERTDPEAVVQATKDADRSDLQVVSFAVLGHKADVGFMLLGPDLVALRRAQGAFTGAGLELVGSYMSLTEVSEYARDAGRSARCPLAPRSFLPKASGPCASTRCPNAATGRTTGTAWTTRAVWP